MNCMSRSNGTRTDTKIQTYRTVLCTDFCASVVHDSWGLRQLSISKHAPPQPSPTAAASANRHIVRSARRILRRAPLGRLPLQRVHSQGDERGDGDTRRHGLARRRARRRRKRTTQCSGCPNALPCLETQQVRPQHQIRCARHAVSSVASTVILGTGKGEATLGACV